MRPSLVFAAALACAAAAFACHNQSRDNDNAQAGRGTPSPDTTAVPPQPMVATSAGPVSSVPAANLAGTVPKSPPIHDGAVACSVQIGNMTAQGREYSAANMGNLDLRECKAFVYVYDKSKKQIARIELDPVGASGAAKALPPKQVIRGVLPLPQNVAADANDWFEPVVTHVRFGDGTAWDAPDRAPAQRPFAQGNTPNAY